MKINEDLIIGEKSTTLGQVATDVENLKGYVLYDTYNASYNTTITLSDSTQNYKYLRIYYYSNDPIYGSIDILNPYDKEVGLWSFFPSSDGMYVKGQIFHIYDTTIAPRDSKVREINLYTGGCAPTSNTQIVRIRKVIGYK
jgi:hypothetical protein